MSELKRELQESNLALSEARSLVSAMQRQEQSMRDKFNQEIRELQMKLHKAQGSLHLEHDMGTVLMEKQNLQLKLMVCTTVRFIWDNVHVEIWSVQDLWI